ncbi:MAG: DUF2520 domain-containing protein [Myxococcales bacterium]
MRVCVLGRGKVGTSLTRALRRAKCPVVQLRGRPPWRSVPQADVYLLAVPDAALALTAEALATLELPAGACALHCAGARAHEELAALRGKGLAIGTMHPLVSFADRARPPTLGGTTFVTTGDARAKRSAQRLARILGARTLEAARLGPSYHAAAALVANGGAALVGEGLRILLALGFARPAAEQALAGLLRSVAENVGRVGIPGALTGPVVRGDASTVGAHLRALRALGPARARAYASLQPLVIACAEEAGLSARDARRMRAVLAEYAKPSRRTPQRKT